MNDGERKYFFVSHAADGGRCFKMVIQGDLRRLSVEKIRRYLQSYDEIPAGFQLRHEGIVLTDRMVGAEFNLREGATLQLFATPTAGSSRTTSGGGAVSSPRSAGVVAGQQQQTHTSRREAGQPPQTSRAAAAAAAAIPPFAAPASASSPLLQHSPVTTASSSYSQRQRVSELMDERDRLHEEIHLLKRKLASSSPTPPHAHVTRNVPVEKQAQRCLQHLASSLSLTLHWDEDYHCDFQLRPAASARRPLHNSAAVSLSLTFDSPSELFLLSAVVADRVALQSLRDEVRGKLYEVLLQGSLLCGRGSTGGCGAVLRMIPCSDGGDTHTVLLTTTTFVKYARDDVLIEVVPAFVTAAHQWRGLIRALLE